MGRRCQRTNLHEPCSRRCRERAGNETPPLSPRRLAAPGGPHHRHRRLLQHVQEQRQHAADLQQHGARPRLGPQQPGHPAADRSEPRRDQPLTLTKEERGVLPSAGSRCRHRRLHRVFLVGTQIRGCVLRAADRWWERCAKQGRNVIFLGCWWMVRLRRPQGTHSKSEVRKRKSL